MNTVTPTTEQHSLNIAVVGRYFKTSVSQTVLNDSALSMLTYQLLQLLCTVYCFMVSLFQLKKSINSQLKWGAIA